MADALTIVSASGFDPEEVDHPATLQGDCPVCERSVRFVERQLVKNIRLFNVPLLAVERGARVFQCPRCETCVEVPDAAERASAGVVSNTHTLDPKRLAEIQQTLIRTEDEASLWKLRVELARRNGADDLAHEALALAARYSQRADGLRRDLARLRGAPTPPGPPGNAREDTRPIVIPAPPAPPERAPEAAPAEVDDEMAALKKLLRKRD